MSRISETVYKKFYVLTSICIDYISNLFCKQKFVKCNLANLKKFRLASVKHFKKQKLEQTPLNIQSSSVSITTSLIQIIQILQVILKKKELSS